MLDQLWEQITPEYIKYWYSVGIGKFFRVFWYFCVFEFPRYVFMDYIITYHLRQKKKEHQARFDRARTTFLIEQPLISIIVPGHNEGKHIYKLTKCLAEQTYQNFELIICDDGSTDLTPVICKSLKDRKLIDTFIRVETRGGKASAANLALRYTKGKYIVHLDADSSLDRDSLEKIIVPFYYSKKIGAVGGNVKVRNYKESLCARLQAIEYLKTISIGRIVTSQLGICRIISGAYGAFRRDILDAIGGWDIGPGLDGDITVKIRKCGYDIHFESRAICLTAAPIRFKALRKQRLRWDKSLIRFRIRKHRNVFFPMANFRWSNFFSASENIFYNLILDITWIVYMIDVLLNYTSHLLFIIPMNFTLYVVMNVAQMWCVLAVSERRREETELIRYLLLMPFYTGIYLRIIRSVAYFQELMFKRSYEDPWNPEKTSRMAKRYGL